MIWTSDLHIGTCCKIGLVVFLIAVAVLQQGCVVAAWVAAVCADSMRAGDVHFQPFEASWVSNEPPGGIVKGSSLKSIALMPVEGDEAMGLRLTKLLSEETALRVVTTSGDPLRSVTADDEERARLARVVSQELGVDAVLYGHVVCAAPQSSRWGWKTEETRRLFLYLLDRDGHLLWRDQLPFLVVTGTKPALEDSLQQALTRQFMDHVRELGLDTAGYLPPKSS